MAELKFGVLPGLEKQLAQRRLTSHRQVFLLTVDESGAVTCVAKEERTV